MITYEQVCKFGFKREEIPDTVHDKQYGWPYFIMTKKIKKGVHVEWSPIDRLATFAKVGETDEMFVVDNPVEFDLMMKVFG